MKKGQRGEQDLESVEEEVYKTFNSLGYDKLTNIQEKAIHTIVRRIDTLLIAPTGSGKTEAAVLPIFTLLKDSNSNGIRALYITPLRALNRDIFRRIIDYANYLGLKAAVRHGDTSNKERRAIISKPPDILITTPESLAIILANEKMRLLLKSIEWIVIDEIHELLANKRGAHLALSLERLEEIASNDITRIGLSATIGNINDAARFLTSKRCAILIDNSIRKYDIDVIYKDDNINSIARIIADYINNSDSRSILLFTNTRDEAEYLSTILKAYTNIAIDVHHGSLSKVVREETEQRLREGDAGLVVATSSLELGLDIGSIDLVIHYNSPRQVSKLAQRIGRSKHKVNHSAKGLIIANNKDDELEAKAIISRLKKGSIEKQILHEDALDIVAHHLVGLALERREVGIDEALSIFSRAYQFRNLTIDDIRACLDILSKSRIVRVYDDKYKRAINAKKYYYENVSTIPDILKFDVVDITSNKVIGSLDQEFVGDYGEKGNVFILKGSQWRVLAVDDSRLKVSVEPVRNAMINVPYWVGELMPVDYHTARLVERLRKDDPYYRLDNARLDGIVIESLRSMNSIVIHACFGNKVNNTLATLLSTIISSKTGYMVEARADAYRIALTSSARIQPKHIMDCLLDEYELEPIIVVGLANTHNLNWRLWLVAKRFGLIDKKAVYDKKAARLLYDRYSKTPVVKEAIRELLHDKYDIDACKQILNDVRSNKIKVRFVEVDEFSSIAKPIIDHASKFSSMPLSIEQGIIELVKERLEKSKHRLICIRCGRWEAIVESNNAYDIRCKLCKSRLVTATYVNDNNLSKIISKRLKGLKLKDDEEKEFMRAWKKASLIYNFGRKALIVLSGYGVGVDTAARILRDCVDDSNLYKMVYEAEKQYITTRGFWND